MISYENRRDRKVMGEAKHDDSGQWRLDTADVGVNRLYSFCASVAALREPVLICGETGTGKDVVAQEIHRVSGLDGSFVVLNVGGLDGQLLSDTLFGHRRGAYTGAGEHRSGLVAEAAGGTLFLDEIGDLDATGQIKLLRLIENAEYYPLGSDKPEKCRARMILATNQDLHDLMQKRRFRSDLYYRISTYEVHLTPLRDRASDIIPLFTHFAEKAAGDFEIQVACNEKKLGVLLGYKYPGNIRELRSIAYRCVHLARSIGRSEIDSEMIAEVLASYKGTRLSRDSFNDASPVQFPARLPDVKNWVDALISEALRRSNDNVSVAARSIGLSPQALHQRLQRRRK